MPRQAIKDDRDGRTSFNQSLRQQHSENVSVSSSTRRNLLSHNAIASVILQPFHISCFYDLSLFDINGRFSRPWEILGDCERFHCITCCQTLLRSSSWLLWWPFSVSFQSQTTLTATHYYLHRIISIIKSFLFFPETGLSPPLDLCRELENVAFTQSKIMMIMFSLKPSYP